MKIITDQKPLGTDDKGNLKIYGEIIHQCPAEFVTKEEIASLQKKRETYHKAHEENEKAISEWVKEECRVRDLVGERMYENRIKNHKKLRNELQNFAEVDSK